mmetsp:Transcript_21060/g.20246  ORF Transcript_21060/g.20246 Transcript_21060/m.20246 type:complete len:389 (-) Transcript_21060:132-1298(-)|eukprot:CAMPEP_0197829426 /NCGR_PEP_ID=MMETSP1437-20131217/5887_1 /TAXON_ID=49252 ORGANISM="Eucampia antarctica, Strain CCMP1452" /NCGR_SAMPLE_ID=MMETSP1437 /ASSEMBLY_ACC=CAM_ASM_001096 /LENGTH=388 /DNA_ID=CAMNT_0043431091 /DNA_START=37 /DNA_END=1203 /DNA_ORIENTATION=-
MLKSSLSLSLVYGRNSCCSSLREKRKITTLILLRHGQSVWNGREARFTGWSDVPLTVKGRVEAVAAGQLLRSRGFKAERVDVAFTSNLQRAYETCELALASMAGSDQDTWSSDRIRKDWRLNERHYGCVQGKYKSDPELARIYGKETLTEWRRSMTARPPPLKDLDLPENSPTTESLRDCQERILKCWYDTILPCMYEEEGLSTQAGHRTVVVVAHSNTLRSLMAALDDVPEHLVANLHVPNSVPILYTFCPNSRGELVSEKLESAAGGSHARWLVSSCNHHAVRDAIQPGGMLTRSLFDYMDLDGNGTLTVRELETGISELLKEEQLSSSKIKIDCAVINVAKKIAIEMPSHSAITLEQFEKKAAAAYRGLQTPSLDNYFHDSEPFP